MPLRIVSRVDGRYDDRVAATPDGWATASPRALTRWNRDVPGGACLVVDRPWRGPLSWLPGAGALGWGPIVIDGAEPRWQPAAVKVPPNEALGRGVAVSFDIVDGVCSGDGRLVAVALRRPQPRTIGSGSITDAVRLAVVDPVAGRLIDQRDPRVPTAMLWGAGPLAIAFPGQLDVRDTDGSWTSHTLDQHTGIVSLAHARTGAVAVGTASGRIGTTSGVGPVVTHPAHEGPVTALATTDSGDVVSGGHDGVLRRWRDGAVAADLDLGGPVLDLAVAGEQVGAIVGGDENALVLIEL